MNELEIMKEEYSNCFKGHKLVFGEGRMKAKIMLIGEAPGENEEKQGRPFVGKAGKNLDEFLEVVELKREEIYITNVVKFRPTKENPKTGRIVNRPPTASEIKDFMALLNKEIEYISPLLIVTLGNVPLKAVTGDEKITIGDVHGQLLNQNGRKIFPLYHPAAIIYNQNLKGTYYEDLANIRAYL